jgi:primosomal protein N' (replication factor Y)
MIAKIAVSAAIYAIDKPYDYSVPATLECQVQPGIRVMVPFGQGNRRCEGMVLAVEPGTMEGLKPIDRCLDESPILSQELLHTAAFVRERYFCTFYDAIKAVLPAGLWYTPVDSFTVASDLAGWENKTRRNPAAQGVMQAILDLHGQADLATLKKQFPDEDSLRASLKYLLEKGLLTTSTEFSRKVGDKTESVVGLAVCAEEAMEYARRKKHSAPLQYAVLELLSTIGSGAAKEVCYFTGASSATLRRLEKLGYVEFTAQEVFRRPTVSAEIPASPVVLVPEQQNAYDGLRAQMMREKPGVALLYGITGSGKTAVYLRLIADCLDAGKSAMLLVPEIALTPQLMQLFVSHFGDRVAVLHSSLRVGERYDEWKRIRSGQARLVIGTRSAVFAPLVAPGLLILDEEQEHTYKSENSPRYHAREVAIYRGAKTGALVLLGSATPSIETMYRAKSGVYTLYQLRNRYNGKDLPQVDIVDMKQELKNGNGTAISGPLEEQLVETMLKGHQSILFLNRRGTSRLMLCVDCGEAPQCPRCSVNLTYHAANGRLMCHYCGHSQPLPDRCPQCGGPLKQVGVGTQKVQEELTALFPGRAVLRMDADTISATNSHEKVLSKFEKEKIPMLIGTQMVTKGLNFDNVTLVGVLDADMSLYVDSYRASETTFSMITQVVGRAGRGQSEGRALIQTMTPENTVMTLAACQDYDSFYDMEIQLRQLRNCPPFADLITVTFTGLFENQVIEGAVRFRDTLGQQLQRACPQEPVTVLGPAPAAVTKVNNTYRYRLTISCHNTKPLRTLLAALLKDFAKDKRSKGVTAFADCNPYD